MVREQAYTCTDLGGADSVTNNFKFNATDSDSNTYETSVISGDYPIRTHRNFLASRLLFVENRDFMDIIEKGKE